MLGRQAILYSDLRKERFRAVLLRVQGLREKEQHDLEVYRLFTTVLLQPHAKSTLKPENVVTFAWEQPKRIQVTEEQYSFLQSQIDKAAKKLWQS